MLSAKERVIAKLNEVKDDRILEELLAIIEFEMNKEIYVEFSKEQADLIELSRNQIAKGDSHSNKEVDNSIDKWLEK